MLSKLVKIRLDLIGTLNDALLQQRITDRINLLSVVQLNNELYTSELGSIVNYYKDLQDNSILIINRTKSTIAIIEDDIAKLVQIEYAGDIYKQRFNADMLTPDIYNNIPVSEAVDFVIRSRIKQYCDWHYPGLQLGSRFKTWSDCLITCDPLYLESNSREVLTDIISLYPAEYARRLRTYTNVSLLPVGQFGFVLAWNHFNYVAFEMIKTQLMTVFDLIRPGGTFMFSYNNCDLSASAILAEDLAMSYANVRIIEEACIEAGYEITAKYDIETDDVQYSHISWIEVRKPGVLSTVKAHQVLGQIIAN